MDRKRAAAALLALAACIACSSAAPTASNQTALELMDGPSDGCYYNFQHYGEGDRIMTNEPCLNCTCHKRMLMCYLRVCPFTKPIGQDCTVEKRADQCCPIVTCPDVPVDLLTSTSTSSPAEYGTTGVGKLDKYGCSINGRYFSEGSKVPSTPNKPCEHCYCIRNMTTCVMQECTLHVDGCTPIYHKDVCCPVRYSCDHEEDEILLLDDMTTTVRPTPGFLLTTTTAMPVTQITQDCVHDDQVFPDGTLIKTEKACEHCYCMKGDIVCVVQECGTPMENEGKNCTSLPPRHGQCCPDTYICEGDDRSAELTTEIQQEQSTQPPRRVGVEGSGYRNEPDEPFTEKGPFETDIEGSGEDYATDAPIMTIENVITDKIQPDIIDETFLSTTEKEEISHITEPDKDQNTIPDIVSDTAGSNLPETSAQTTEDNLELTSIDTSIDQHKNENEISKENEYITTESPFKKDDNSIVSDEMLTIKDNEKLPTTMVDLVEDTTFKDELLDNISTEDNSQPQQLSTTVSDKSTPEVVEIDQEKEATIDNQPLPSSTESIKSVDEDSITTEKQIFTGLTTMAEDKTETLETTSINPDINEIDEDIPVISSPGRIPGEGDCLLNGITYTNNTTVPTSNNCHTSCKCVSSIVKCDPIICSLPPEYVENMNDCQPIYDSPDACCPTYVCSAKETIPPESHNQMSGTESPKPISESGCNSEDCILNEVHKEVSKSPSSCTSESCLDKSADEQDKGDCGLNGCVDETPKPLNQDCVGDKCQILPVIACEGDNCVNEHVSSEDSQKIPDSDKGSVICDENNDCKILNISQVSECKDESCKKQVSTETEANKPSECTEPECKAHDIPFLSSADETTEQNVNEQVPSEDSQKTPDLNKEPSVACDENNDCKTLHISQDGECKDEICKKQGVETEVNVPKDCTDPECKTHDITLSLPAEETTEQTATEEVPSEDSQKIPDSGKEPSVVCDENNDCKTLHIPQEGECKDESCKKQVAETEVNVPKDCTEPECKTHDVPLLLPAAETTEKSATEEVPSEDSQKIPDSDKEPSVVCDENNNCNAPDTTQDSKCKDGSCKNLGVETGVNIPTDCIDAECKTPSKASEETTDSTLETGSNDIIQTDVTQNPPDAFTENPEKSTKTDEKTPAITNDVNTEPSKKLTTISDAFSDVTIAPIENEITESPMIEKISQKDDTKTTDGTIIEHVTESLAPQDDKVTVVDETAIDKKITTQEPYEPTKTESEDQANKMDATTEILEVVTESNVQSTKYDEKYETVSKLDSEKEETPTSISELNQNEELSTTEASVASDKLTTVKEISELYEIQKENTEVPITLKDKETQTEKITSDYVEVTEVYELPHGTIDPNEQLVETHTEKEKTETPESPATEVKVVTTDKLDVTVEPYVVPTELPQSSQTKLDQDVKDVTETITDKHEIFTEPSDYITPKVEEATLEPSVQPDELPKEDNKPEVTEESITEKVTVTKISDSPTKIETTLDEFGQFVTKPQDAYTETPLEKVDEISSIPTEEKKEPVTEKSSTSESESTEKQEIYTELPKEYEQELHTTIGEGIINPDQKPPIDSRTELPSSFTISSETTMAIKEQDYTYEPEKTVTKKVPDSSDDLIHATSESDKVPLTEVYQQFTEKPEVTMTDSTPPPEFIDENTRRQNTMQTTSDESNKINEIDSESHKQTTVQDNILIPEATTITHDHVQVVEDHTKSPLQNVEKPEEPSTDAEKELPLEMDVTSMDTVTEPLPQKSDETYVTLPIDTVSKDDGITEKYATESQNTETEVPSLPHLDSSTEPSKHIFDESTEARLPQEEIEMLDKVTTLIPHVEENTDKQPEMLTESEMTSHNIEKTTASFISIEEKETEPPSHVTESYSHVEQTATPTSALMIEEHDQETTEKSVSEDVASPQQTNEYSPIDGVTEEISSQTLLAMSTEKTKIKDTPETLVPNDIGTTQSVLLTKPEESSVTDSALLNEEKDIVTEFPHSYTTVEDLDKSSDSVQKGDDINKQTEPVEDNQALTTETTVKFDEEKEITTPVSDISDIKQITEVEKNEVGTESTTRVFDDTNVEVEDGKTVPDSHITESQTEKSQDEITQQQESTTDKIKITEIPDYLSSSQSQEQQTTSSIIDVEISQPATVTEKQGDQTESVSEEQPTETELHGTEDSFASTVKEGIIILEDEKATPTLVPDFEQPISYSPESHATELVSEDKTTVELKPTTMSYETYHGIETEEEKSQEPFDVVTTEAVIKQSETEENELDIVKYTLFDTSPTDKPSIATESNKYDNNEDQTRKTTEAPISAVSHTSTESIQVATAQEVVSVSVSQASETATTESQYATIAEEKESSTATSNVSEKEPEQSSTDDEKIITQEPEDVQGITIKENSQQTDDKKVTTSPTEDIRINTEPTKPTVIQKEQTEKSEVYGTESSIDAETEKQISENELDKMTTETVQTLAPHVNVVTELPLSTAKIEEPYVTEENKQTTESQDKFSETTQFLVELEEHTHPAVDEMTTKSSLEDVATTVLYETPESQQPERGDQIPEDLSTHKDEYPTGHSETTAATVKDKEQPVTLIQDQIDESTSVIPPKAEIETPHVTESIPMQTSNYEPVETEKDSTKYDDTVTSSPTPQTVKDTTLQDYSTESTDVHKSQSSTLSNVEISSEQDIQVSSEKPEIFEEKLTPELPKETTNKISEETVTSTAMPQEKPVETTLRPATPDVPKPEYIDEHNEELPPPDFPPSGGYGQEPDYIDEDQAFGPGTCRYGGKVYVSAQQIPRDDPCDFCFCFRSDIICLQQSCPPPIHGCHEEPIQGFCCPRYECPVSMATTLNVTTTTTTTTTTLPPHFLPHAYKGAAQRRGCQIKGHTYKVGEVVRASSGPCLHCTCGGDGQMKCDPKACTPEPMLRQMIAAAVSAKRRR